MVRALALDAAINEAIHRLKRHAPHHESDHVLNLAYNVLTDGDCVEDLERLRADETYMDALGASIVHDSVHIIVHDRGQNVSRTWRSG